MTTGTAAGTGETTTIVEDKITFLAFRGEEDKARRGIPRHRFHNVPQVLLDLSFRHFDDGGNLRRRHGAQGQQVGNTLAWGAVGRHNARPIA